MVLKQTFALRSVVCALVFLATSRTAISAPKANPLLHKPAPSFVRNDIHGHRIDLASYRGQVVLLTFWATWCAGCQIEMPHFVRWQQELGPKGLQIVAISMDDDSGPVLALTQHRNVNYPVIMGDKQLGDLYGGVLGLPVSFLIDRHGNVAAVFTGESKIAVMKALVINLLGEQ